MKKCKHEWHFYEKENVTRGICFGSMYAKFICRKCGKVDWVKARK